MSIRRPPGRTRPLLTLLGLLLPSLLLPAAPAQAQTQPLIASKDTYLKRWRPNKNKGDQQFLRVRAPGRNRTLVQFDQAEIADTVGTTTLVSAKLRLYITSRRNIRGNSGQEVAVHRMSQAWTEGGATWNCPDDPNPSNRRPDCTRWNLRKSSEWPFVGTPTAVILHQKGQSGWVDWDVTADVAAFLDGTATNNGWIVKKVDEGQSGHVQYSSREGAFPPELVLEVRGGVGLPPGFGLVLGQVVDATTGQPLAGTTVKALGTTSEVLSDSQGNFQLPAPEGTNVPVYFNKGGYVDAKFFTVVEEGRESTLGTIQLQPFDQVATIIGPQGGSHTDSTGTVTAIFPAGAVGTDTLVTATVFPTVEDFPVPIPEGQAYIAGVQFTPEHLEFLNGNTVTVRIANTLNIPVGTDMPFAFANHSEDDPGVVFFDQGMGTVVEIGGQTFIEAEVPHFSCVSFVLPVVTDRPPVVTQSPNVSSENTAQNPNKCCPAGGSRMGAQDGTLFLDQVLPSTRVLGRVNSLTLSYSSATVDPHPLILSEAFLDPSITTLPEQVTWRLRAGPLEEERIFTPQAGTFRYAWSWEPRDSSGNVLPTGIHRVEVTLSHDYQGTLATADTFGGPPIQDLGIPTPGLTPESVRPDARVVIHNRLQSPFGAGWGLQGLQRLHPQPAGSVVVTDGDGTALTFRTRSLIYATVDPPGIGQTTPFGGLSALDADTGELEFIFPDITTVPKRVILSAAGEMAFVATDGGVAFVDTRSQDVVGSVIFSFAQDLAVSPDGTTVYAVGSNPRRFYIIDVPSLSVVFTLNPAGTPVAVALSPDGNLAYVGQQGTQDVLVFDTQTRSVVTFIPLGNQVTARAMTLSVDGQTLYVGISTGVAVINTTTNSLQTTIPLGHAAFGLALTPAGRLFVASRTPNVKILDTSSLTVVGTVTVPVSSSESVAVSPDGQQVLVIGNESVGVQLFEGFVFVVDAASEAILDQFALPDGVATSAAVRAGDPNRPLAPPGDFSTLTRNNQGTPTDPSDDTWVRRMKDGTEHIFSADGLLLETRDRNGNQTLNAYDASGKLTSRTDPGGGVTSFSYSGAKLTSITDPAGRTTLFSIDSAGDLVAVTTPDGAKTQYSYDSRHRVIARTDARSVVTQYQYDSFGRLSRVIHPTGEERTLLPSDAQALLNNVPPGTPATPIPVVAPLAQLTDGLGRTTEIETGPVGSATQTTDPLGRTTEIERDDHGLPLEIIQPNGLVNTLTYDNMGNLLSTKQTGPLLGTILASFTYEPVFNQVTSITDPEGSITTISYDANGNPTQITDALSNTTTLAYDSRGLLTTVTDALSNVTTFAYDAKGNLTSTTDPLGNTTMLSYDAAGNVVTSTDALGRTTQFAYDPTNRLTQVTDAAGGITRYAYDGNGNLTSVTDANGQATTFQYDAVNQLIQTTNPLGQAKTFAYDLARNLVSTVDPNNQTITFTYDAANQLIQKTLPGPEVVTFAYDLVGNLTLAQDADSTLTFEYDVLGRVSRALTAATAAQLASTLNYAYDKNGSRIQRSGSVGGTLTYTYDALNRLTRLSAPNGFTDFSYDARSRRTTMALPNGVLTNYTYDAASQLTSLVHDLAGSPVASSTLTYDDVGNRTSLTDLDGAHSFLYDALNRLNDATHLQPANPTENFTYDPVGNRTSSHLATSQAYDVANRLLEDSNFTYTYDANGNLVQKVPKGPGETTTYMHDAENRLIEVSTPTLVATYRYDALGRRIEKNVNGTVTRYIYDNEDIIAEFDGSNIFRASFVHGPGIDEPIAMFRAGFFHHYHTDGLGAITVLTDPNGTPVRSYTYDSFGQIVDQAGTVTNPYTYTAREFDPETGLYYYRARYYDPISGRFLQEDPLGYAGGEVNLYTYVGNSPVGRIDPLGLEWVELHAQKGGGTSGGVPSSGGGWGHAWVDLYDKEGNRIGRGFYPAEPAGLEAILGGKYGTEFLDDTGTGHVATSTHRWEITTEEYERALRFLHGYNRDWSLLNNCTDFAVDTARAAGVIVENYTRFGVSDPDRLADELNRLIQPSRVQ